MERRVAPGRVVDPGPAEVADPAPAAVTVRRPAGDDVGRVPDHPVLGRAVPATVLVEVGVPDHLPRHVARRAAALIAAVAVRAPGVEPVEPIAGPDSDGRGIRAFDVCRLARKHLLRAGAQEHRGFAFAHDDRRARTRSSLTSIRYSPARVSASCVFGVSIRAASPASSTRTRTITRPCATNSASMLIVEPRDVHVRVACEPELPAAVVDLGAAVRRRPTGCHPLVTEAVAQRLDPVVRALLGGDVYVAAQVGEPADAGREVLALRAGERSRSQQQGHCNKLLQTRRSARVAMCLHAWHSPAIQNVAGGAHVDAVPSGRSGDSD